MFLIVRVSTAATDGRDQVALFARGRKPVGEAKFSETQELCGRHGYEIRSMLGHVDRAEWPLVVVAYKSRSRDGVGRLGGQYMMWPARKIGKTVRAGREVRGELIGFGMAQLGEEPPPYSEFSNEGAEFSNEDDHE